MGSCSKGTIGCLVIQVSPSILIFYSITELLEERIGTLLLGAYSDDTNLHIAFIIFIDTVLKALGKDSFTLLTTQFRNQRNDEYFVFAPLFFGLKLTF